MNLKNNNQLHFEPVNSENRREAENLSVFSEQSGFIESVGECLQEADNLKLWRPVCIYDGDTLVGFAMYGYFPSSTYWFLSSNSTSVIPLSSNSVTR